MTPDEQKSRNRKQRAFYITLAILCVPMTIVSAWKGWKFWAWPCVVLDAWIYTWYISAVSVEKILLAAIEKGATVFKKSGEG